MNIKELIEQLQTFELLSCTDGQDIEVKLWNQNKDRFSSNLCVQFMPNRKTVLLTLTFND
jgi:hypothetical protein